MAIETLGEAANAKWSVIASCRATDCAVREQVNMRALLWRSGRAFPLKLLPTHLRCPVCGSREVSVAFSIPPAPTVKPEGYNRYLVEQIDRRGAVVDVMARSRFNGAQRLFQSLVDRKPGCRFVFRDGGRIIETYPPREK